MDEAQSAALTDKIVEAIRAGSIPEMDSFTADEKVILRGALVLFKDDRNRAAIERMLPLLDTEEKTKSLAFAIRAGGTAIVLGKAMRLVWSVPGALVALVLITMVSDVSPREVISWLVPFIKP